MKRVGIIGLGNMGIGMAKNLLENGFELSGYDKEIKDHIGHIHIKDCRASIARATVRFCPLGEGDMAPYLEGIAGALKKDGYQGVVSLVVLSPST